MAQQFYTDVEGKQFAGRDINNHYYITSHQQDWDDIDTAVLLKEMTRQKQQLWVAYKAIWFSIPAMMLCLLTLFPLCIQMIIYYHTKTLPAPSAAWSMVVSHYFSYFIGFWVAMLSATYYLLKIEQAEYHMIRQRRGHLRAIKKQLKRRQG